MNKLDSVPPFLARFVSDDRSACDVIQSLNILVTLVEVEYVFVYWTERSHHTFTAAHVVITCSRIAKIGTYRKNDDPSLSTGNLLVIMD